MTTTKKTREQIDYEVDAIGLATAIVQDHYKQRCHIDENLDLIANQALYIQKGVENYDETGELDRNVIESANNMFANFYNEFAEDGDKFLFGNLRDELNRIALNV